jgi:hypothetical protein
MISRKSGHILATSSISGRFGFPLRSAYSASKQALHGFFETLYLENKNIISFFGTERRIERPGKGSTGPYHPPPSTIGIEELEEKIRGLEEKLKAGQSTEIALYYDPSQTSSSPIILSIL